MTSFRSSSRPGAALVIVVVLVTMLMVLILAFFSLSRLELRASRAYADSVTTNVLADSALNAVVAQIRDATSGLGTTQTWASQPGMIRRYDNTGELVNAFKLYSSASMVEDSSFDPQKELPPANWATDTGLWVDLNEPVLFDRDGDGEPDDADGDGMDDAAYPIIHRAALDEIEGFDVDESQIPGATENQPLPMPVRWLYMLRDGQLVAGTSRRKVVTIPEATTDNPVVGRVAFWADDESCKVNINTASEGFYWDIPRTNSTSEVHFADRQPVVNEFQRYPGHPATTSLSPVLGKWLGDPGTTTMNRASRIYKTYYDLTPRIVYGGSVEATARDAKIDSRTYRRYGINLDEDVERLYSSVDEYVFGATERTENEAFKSARGDARDIVEKTKFFLTAHSQAPEVNLFNQPRIALWPLQADEGDRNVVDKLIAFCASTKSGSEPLPYYFQRPTVHTSSYGSSQSPTQFWSIDRNQDLYNYMKDLMGRNVPGYGGKFSSKFGADANQIVTEMVDYVRSGLNTSAYGKETDNQKSGYSFTPPHHGAPGYRQVPGEGQVIPLQVGDTMGFGRNQTITEAALVIYPTARFGRQLTDIPALNEKKGFKAASVRAFLILEFFNPSPGLPSWSPFIEVEIEGLDGFALSEGGGGVSLNMPESASMTLDALVGPARGAATGDAPGHAHPERIGYGNNSPHFGMFQPFYAGGVRPSPIRSARSYAFHSTADCPISTASSISTGLTLIGTDLTITLKSGHTGETVQQINMTFPDMKIPRPYVWKDGQALETNLSTRILKGANEYQWALIRPGDVVRSMEADREAVPKGDLRFYSATPVVPSDWFRPGGAGRDDIPSEPRTPQWNSTDVINGRFAHGLRQYNSWQFWGQFCSVSSAAPGLDAINNQRGDHPYHRIPSLQTSGSLIPNHHLYAASSDDWAVYRDAHFVTARGLKGAFRSDRQAGDFDSGFGFIADGPYINKPDEGNAYSPDGMSSFQGGNDLRTGAYYNLGNYETDAASITTFPNRQIASAIQFGSLPTGLKRGQPWQTLLFNPAPSGRDHPGARPPHDHLIADWWWMPAAQPYPISQPMATSGKINLNYDILPFRYIKRRTPIHSLLKAVQITAIPPYFATRHSTQGKNNNYRQGLDAPVSQASRYGIDPDHVNGTLKGFEDRFKDGKLFRSATEICEIFLVPEPLPDFRRDYPRFAARTSYDSMESWWRGRRGLSDPQNFSLTGDNLRETPYNNIYPRCTTKSNTFLVHLHVQRLVPAGLDPTRIDLDTARVAGKWRGSVLVERFVDPNDEELPDFAKESNASLDDHYRLRVLERKEFKPL